MKLPVLTFIIALTLIACSTQKSIEKPPSAITNDSSKIEIADSPVSNSVKELKSHIVQNGESLSVIAQKYGVTVQQLVDTNNIENANLIRIGQKLVIPDVEKD